MSRMGLGSCCDGASGRNSMSKGTEGDKGSTVRSSGDSLGGIASSEKKRAK